MKLTHSDYAFDFKVNTVMLPSLFVSVTHIKNPSLCDLTFKELAAKECLYLLQYSVHVTKIYPPSLQSFHNYLGPTFLSCLIRIYIVSTHTRTPYLSLYFYPYVHRVPACP